MKAAAVIFACACILSCAGLPRIIPAGASEAGDLQRMARAPFLEGEWRVVHSIQGRLPGGSTADMIGVTVASSRTGKLRSTLMSIEGLVFLDAEYGSRLVINRGIGPLGRPDLVTGMMRDIRLILFAPSGAAVETGALAGRGRACRYRSEDGSVYVILNNDGTIEIRSYDGSSKLLRTVRFLKRRSDGIPSRVYLESAGIVGYSLSLDLIEAEKIR
ncbi:MAG: hypothetical protein KA369_20540 [Spirochaetes bacterium]|nr:hypothetical protein [Spirochaetota bacterium]